MHVEGVPKIAPKCEEVILLVVLFWAHPLYGMLNLTNKWTGSRKL